MTPFETQVAKVLREQLLAATLPHDSWYQPLADVLAPRVAAAIHASADTAVDQDYQLHEAAALAALRGGPA